MEWNEFGYAPHFAVTTSGAAQRSHPPHPRQKLRPHALACAAFPDRGPILQQNLDKQRAHGVVVSHPLSMWEALGSIPSVSTFQNSSIPGTHSPLSSPLHAPLLLGAEQPHMRSRGFAVVVVGKIHPEHLFAFLFIL